MLATLAFTAVEYDISFASPKHDLPSLGYIAYEQINGPDDQMPVS
jgi:hypothetical protein